MKNRKSALSLILVLALASIMLLSGCGSGGDTAGTADTKAASTSGQSGGDTSAKDLYGNIDLSKAYTVNMYALGDVPQDTELVVGEINKILEPLYNTKLDLKFMAWSDYQTKYGLILASGDAVDLMTTAPWCYYYTESAKGAFMEITDEFLEKAMPQTKSTQAAESWASARINGKIYAVPMNVVQPMSKYVAIRDDLREKYGLPALTDWTSLENYLVAIAEKETPQSGIYGVFSSKRNPEFEYIWQQQYELVPIFFDSFWYPYNGGVRPKAEDIFLYWDSEYFRDFAARMKYLGDKGVWSQDALTNSISPNDAFANGQGACIAWNGTVFRYGKLAEDNLKVKVGYYDLTKDKLATAENYNNNMIAICSAAKSPDRAGMVLDLLKNDTALYRLFVGGIEGKHYDLVDNEHRALGPDAAKYPWDAFSWGVRRADLQPNDLDPRQVAIEDNQKQHMKLPPTNGFNFDQQPVKSEMAAVNSIRDEYLGMLELGKVDDVNGTIDEMVSRMKKAGIDKIKDELLNQYQSWLSTNP